MRQAVGYVASHLGTSALGALTTVLLARALTVDAFGGYSFVTAFLPFVAMFFEFGLFLPSGRLAAQAEGPEARAVAGATLVAYLPVGLAFGVAMLAASYVVDDVFNVAVASPLRLAAPLATALPFTFVAEQLAQGLDRLHVASAASVLSRAGFFVWLVVVTHGGARVTVSVALVAELASLCAASAVLALWLRPLFRRTGDHLRDIVRGARRYGLEAYLGRVLSVGTYNMDVLMLAAFTDARAVALYTLAGAIAYPVGLPGIGASAALFPRFTREQEIDPRVLWTVSGLGAAGAIGATLLTPAFLRIVLPRYSALASLVLPLALAQAVRGVTSLYNGFLSAHARGRELRNTALVLTTTNLALNFALIPTAGAAGAAWASLAALGCNLAVHLRFYRMTCAGEEEAPSPAPMPPVDGVPPTGALVELPAGGGGGW